MADIHIFEDQAFSEVTLSDRVSRMPYVPGRIGKMNIFEVDGIRTTDLAVEERDGQLSLIPNTDRDGPDNVMASSKRRTITFQTTHRPLKRVIRPQEIQNIRPFGDSDELMEAQAVVDEKLKEMVPYHDATFEHLMLGALRGYLIDADGSTIIENLYTRFNITQPTQAFDLSDPTTDVRVKSLGAVRMIEDGLGGATYEGIRGICGSEFFDELVSQPSVKTAYERWLNGDFLRSDPRFSGFLLGGIYWEEYRGKVNGVSFIPDAECQIFPVGVPDMYVGRFGPANMIQFANTKGLNRYASIEMLPHGRGVEILTESNPIALNKRPGASVKGTM